MPDQIQVNGARHFQSTSYDELRPCQSSSPHVMQEDGCAEHLQTHNDRRNRSPCLVFYDTEDAEGSGSVSSNDDEDIAVGQKPTQGILRWVVSCVGTGAPIASTVRILYCTWWWKYLMLAGKLLKVLSRFRTTSSSPLPLQLCITISKARGVQDRAR